MYCPSAVALLNATRSAQAATPASRPAHRQRARGSTGAALDSFRRLTTHHEARGRSRSRARRPGSSRRRTHDPAHAGRQRPRRLRRRHRPGTDGGRTRRRPAPRQSRHAPAHRRLLRCTERTRGSGRDAHGHRGPDDRPARLRSLSRRRRTHARRRRPGPTAHRTRRRRQLRTSTRPRGDRRHERSTRNHRAPNLAGRPTSTWRDYSRARGSRRRSAWQPGGTWNDSATNTASNSTRTTSAPDRHRRCSPSSRTGSARRSFPPWRYGRTRHRTSGSAKPSPIPAHANSSACTARMPPRR
jgi:hypothetical protein